MYVKKMQSLSQKSRVSFVKHSLDMPGVEYNKK
jgi:hypothetical protein